jgi:AhpD family alkylhydroperoxidase
VKQFLLKQWEELRQQPINSGRPDKDFACGNAKTRRRKWQRTITQTVKARNYHPMQIQSSPWKTLPAQSIAFAVFVGFAVPGQAQQTSVDARAEKMNRSERAEDKLHELFGTTRLSEADLDPDFFDIMKRFMYGEVFHQGSLDARQRELIALVVLTTIQCLSEVRLHAAAALNVGVTPGEIKEPLYQCGPFIGFPRVQEALKVVNEVMLSRGISLPLESQRRLKKGLPAVGNG